LIHALFPQFGPPTVEEILQDIFDEQIFLLIDQIEGNVTTTETCLIYLTNEMMIPEAGYVFIESNHVIIKNLRLFVNMTRNLTQEYLGSEEFRNASRDAHDEFERRAIAIGKWPPLMPPSHPPPRQCVSRNVVFPL